MAFMNFQGPTFTMQVPTDWFITSSPQFQAVFTPPKDGDTGVKANLIVSIRPVKKGVTAVAIAQAAKETQQKEYPEYEVVTETAVTDAPVSYFRRLYRWYNTERKVAIVQSQAYYVHENRLYTLTATQPVIGADGNEVDKILGQMMDSFKLETV